MAQNQEFTDFEIETDLNAVNAWDGEQAPLAAPGEYDLRVAHVESKNAKSTNNPMIAVTFEIVKAYDDANAGEVGKLVYNNYVLTQAAMGRMKQLMIACGAPLDKIRGSALLGATIGGTVYHSAGTATVDENGTPRPARDFANVKNERPLEAPAETKVTTPPIARGAAAAKTAGTPAPKNGAGAPRRA